MKFLSPQIDLVFKKLFGTSANKEILIDFLNAILERKKESRIVEVSFSDTNNHLKTLEQKFSIVDVRCTDQKNNNYIVEMQIKNQVDFLQRAQYYGACGLDIQLQPTEKYKRLMPVIFVGIYTNTLFKRHKRYITHHYFTDSHDHEKDLGLLEFHFIELEKFTKTLEKLDGLIDKWIYFIKNAPLHEEVPTELAEVKPFKAAFHVLTQSRWTQQELLLYEKQVDAWRVEASVLETARDEALAKGMKEGMQEGHKLGREEGHKLGREEGHKLGREERSLEVAHNMLAKNIAAATIAEVTGLPVDVIKKLKKG